MIQPRRYLPDARIVGTFRSTKPNTLRVYDLDVKSVRAVDTCERTGTVRRVAIMKRLVCFEGLPIQSLAQFLRAPLHVRVYLG